MKLSRIKNNPDNPRLIRDAKFEQLKRSIVEFPEMLSLRPLIVDERGFALGGNMRHLALKEILKTDFKETFPENFSDSQRAYRRRCYDALRSGVLLDEWVLSASALTEEQKREFIVKDNLGYGEWDFDRLANEWLEIDLTNWGLDIPELTNPVEIDIENFFNQIEPDAAANGATSKNQIVLKYTAEEFQLVKDGLAKISTSPAQAVWSLLGL